MPESFMIRGLHPMIVGIERLQTLRSVIGIRRSRDRQNGMNLGSPFAPLVRYQWVFQAEMVETNRLCRFWKQVNYRSATQTKNFFVYDQILAGPIFEQK